MKSIDSLIKNNIEDKFVFLRSDFNVPIDENNQITDSGRIVASLPTINSLLSAKAKLVIAAHLGRPNGFDKQFSLKPVASELSKQLGKDVLLSSDIIGNDTKEKLEKLNSGQILLLENIRFDKRETSKEDSERESLANEIVNLIGKDSFFVSDGFGVVHRKQASVYDIAKILDSYAGYLVSSEMKVLENLAENPKRPYAVVLGGAKVSDKLGVIKALAPKVDTLIILGGMAYTFLAAKGFEVGQSLLQKEQIDNAKEILDQYADTIHLPKDIVVTEEFSPDASFVTVPIDKITKNQMGMDIGKESIKYFSEIISNAKTVFWNGPAGVFEFDTFSKGTNALAKSISEIAKSGAVTVIGGGDSAAAVRKAGFKDSDFTHISTGGGASLEYLEGKSLPGIEVLR